MSYLPLVLPFLYAATGAIVGAMLARFSMESRDRARAAVQLFEFYNSSDMFAARRDAWIYLKNIYPQNPVAFSKLFSHHADGLHEGKYSSLSRVVYFWYVVHLLERQRKISRKLARAMFRYQYQHWHHALTPLTKATHLDSDDKPEWLPCMDKNTMAWLLKETPGKPWLTR